METKEYKTLPRTDERGDPWPSGAWDAEPDKVQWPDIATGLPCLAVRNQYLGHWCGYVGVPPGHPFHGKEYWDLPYLPAHGGVNFARPCAGGDEEHGVCHVPGAGEPDHVWWLGFDCAHGGDLSPGMGAFHAKYGFAGINDVYRPLPYIKKECAELAAAIAAHEEWKS